MIMAPESKHLPSELEQALAERPEQAAGLRAAWDALGAVPPAEPVIPTTAEAWRELENRLQGRARQRSAPDRRPLRLAWRPRVLSAGVLTVLVIVVGLWWSRPVIVDVDEGVQQVVVLPDGSTVDLNSASELRYDRGFRTWLLAEAGERSVALRGEAFFQVTSDAGRPFVVETPDARIEVVGTAFNVRARASRRGDQTLITLQEGVIRVTSQDAAGEPVVLDSTGASLLVQTGAVPRRPDSRPELEHVLAWRSQGFAAVNEPVGEILREVQRRYSVELELAPGLSTDAEMTLFYLRGTSAEQIIHDLCLARGWQYRPTSRGYYVSVADRSPASAPRTDS